MGHFSYAEVAQKSISQDRLVLFIFLFCAFSILVQVILILGSWNKLPPQVPLFYSRPWGENVLSAPVGLWLLPGIAFFSTVLNFSMAIFWFHENRFILRTLAIFCFLVAFSTFYDTLKIITLLI